MQNKQKYGKELLVLLVCIIIDTNEKVNENIGGKEMFDVVVVGGGVIGGAVLRELTKYRLRVCLLEKENDVAMGASKANSGIVHAGFDAPENSLKALFNAMGNNMMPEYTKELGVKYVNNGSLVVAFSHKEMSTLSMLKERGEKNGVKGLELLSKFGLKMMEPNVSDKAVGALYAPTGGIVCPYELTIAQIGNAMDNGAKLFCNFEVVKAEKTEKGFVLTSTKGERIEGKLIINCAGLGAERIAKLFGDESIRIGARKGEYLLLDRESGDFVSHTLFFAPTKAGKGILLSQTVDNNIILGPTAEEGNDSVDTSAKGMGEVLTKAREMCPNVPSYNVITSFAGVRAFSDRHDFIIEESKSVKGLIHCAGIESPGLTSAPAIGKYVVETLVGDMFDLQENKNFNGVRQPDYFFKNLSVEEQNKLIERIPAYGKIVCRCERITEGEIVRAIKENPPARDIDGIKRRTRSGMGRCQGGFCQPHVAEILARELGISFEEVTKKGKGSELVMEVTK